MFLLTVFPLIDLSLKFDFPKLISFIQQGPSTYCLSSFRYMGTLMAKVTNIIRELNRHACIYDQTTCAGIWNI